MMSENIHIANNHPDIGHLHVNSEVHPDVGLVHEDEYDSHMDQAPPYSHHSDQGLSPKLSPWNHLMLV